MIYKLLTEKYIAPYTEYKHLTYDFQVIVNVAKKGIRPTFPDKTPELISTLIQSMWDSVPTARPDCNSILSSLDSIKQKLPDILPDKTTRKYNLSQPLSHSWTEPTQLEKPLLYQEMLRQELTRPKKVYTDSLDSKKDSSEPIPIDKSPKKTPTKTQSSSRRPKKSQTTSPHQHQHTADPKGKKITSLLHNPLIYIY